MHLKHLKGVPTMKLLSALVILFICSASVLTQGKKPTPPQLAEAQLRALILLWDEAEKKNDVSSIDKLLAPEFSFLGGSTRKEYLEKVAPDPSFKYTSTIDDLKIEIFGDSALATARESIKGSMGNKAAEGTILILTVWIKRLGRWQCVRSSIKEISMHVN